MTIIREYAPSGAIVEEVDEPVTIGNLESFIQQYGEEKAQIYLQALVDFIDETHDIYYERAGEDRYYPRTAGRVQKGLAKFHINKSILIRKFDYLGIKLPDPGVKP